MVAVALLWLPVIAEYPSGHLFDYFQGVTSYLAPPIAATFLRGILVPRVNEKVRKMFSSLTFPKNFSVSKKIVAYYYTPQN